MPPDPRRAAAPDTGLLATLKDCIGEQGLEVEAKSHADSIYAGAIGAAIWGAFRYEKLTALGQLPTCLSRPALRPAAQSLRATGRTTSGGGSEAPASRRQEAS